MLYRGLSCNTEWIKGDRKVGMTLSKQIIIGELEKLTSNKSDCLIPLFHTGHESPESPRIDFFIDSVGFVRFH